jgi:hypothetical protein
MKHINRIEKVKDRNKEIFLIKNARKNLENTVRLLQEYFNFKI